MLQIVLIRKMSTTPIDYTSLTSLLLSSDPPAIPFDVTFLVFDQEKDLPGEVLAFLSFSHLVYCLQLYGWVLNSWKAISSLPFQVFSLTLYPGEPYPEP